MDAARIDYMKKAPAALRPMLDLERYLHQSGLGEGLIHLIKMRASQINGCAYCIDMHSKDARAGGETEQRLYALAAWHEAPFFSERERAALAWTDALTLISENDVSDDLYDEVRAHFSEKDLVDLTMVVVVINGWNRLAIPFRTPVGDYQPQKSAE